MIIIKYVLLCILGLFLTRTDRPSYHVDIYYGENTRSVLDTLEIASAFDSNCRNFSDREWNIVRKMFKICDFEYRGQDVIFFTGSSGKVKASKEKYVTQLKYYHDNEYFPQTLYIIHEISDHCDKVSHLVIQYETKRLFSEKQIINLCKRASQTTTPFP